MAFFLLEEADEGADSNSQSSLNLTGAHLEGRAQVGCRGYLPRLGQVPARATLSEHCWKWLSESPGIWTGGEGEWRRSSWEGGKE